MEVLLPFATDTPYWGTAEGQQLHLFAQKLYHRQYDQLFPLSPNKTADFLNFNNTNSGRKRLLGWVTAGLVAPENISGFSRSSIIIFQKLKVHATKLPTYEEAHEKMVSDFKGSDLRSHIGTLTSDRRQKRLSVTLIHPADPWFAQWEELLKLRSHGLFLG